MKIDNPETGGILDRSHRTKTNATQTTKQKRRETRTLQEERNKQKGSKKNVGVGRKKKVYLKDTIYLQLRNGKFVAANDHIMCVSDGFYLGTIIIF